MLGLTLNGIASQASKLLLPAIAFLLLTISGAIPPTGFLVALLLAVPIVLGVMVGVWVMRSEAFARRVGAFATRATDSVMRRMHRPAPGDLTDRLMTFREAARDLLLARIVPITLSQLLARSVGYVLLLLSMRAVGVGADVLPPEVILAVYAAVMVITLLPIAPGGAGLPEVLYIGFFTAYAANTAWDDAIGAGVMLFRGHVVVPADPRRLRRAAHPAAGRAARAGARAARGDAPPAAPDGSEEGRADRLVGRAQQRVREGERPRAVLVRAHPDHDVTQPRPAEIRRAHGGHGQGEVRRLVVRRAPGPVGRRVEQQALTAAGDLVVDDLDDELTLALVGARAERPARVEQADPHRVPARGRPSRRGGCAASRGTGPTPGAHGG